MSLCVALAAMVMGASGSGPVPTALPHVGSYSLSELHVRRTAVQLQLRCQVLSLGEVIGPFDPDLDGTMEPGELEAHRDAIVEYIAAHYRVVTGAGDDAAASDAERSLRVASSLVVEAEPGLDPLNEVSQWVDVVLDYEVTAPIGFGSVGVHVDLFHDTSPQHSDSSAVVWNGLELAAWRFAAGSEAHVFRATEEMLERNESAVTRYARAGAKRAPRALDAALLVLLVVAAARRGSRRSALVSAGLLLGLGGVGMLLAPRADLLPQHVRFLELTVPLALAYVGLDDLLHNRGRTRLLETTVFGVALGGREATRLAPELSREAGTQEPLLGYALGFGVVLFGLAVAASLLLRDRTPIVAAESSAGAKGEEAPAEGAFSWRPLRAALDVVAMGAGLWYFWSVFRA